MVRLPIEPPKPSERMGSFKLRAEEAGDTLFLFLCREADDDIDADEYLRRLDRAITDIEHVRDAVADLVEDGIPQRSSTAGSNR